MLQKAAAKVFRAKFRDALKNEAPKRFIKMRYYGFFSPRWRNTLQTIKELFEATPTEEHRPLRDIVAQRLG
jgi:hypothetical protein